MSTLEVSSTVELSRLAERANAAHQKAGDSIVSAIIHGLEAGKALVEAQSLVPYGQWGEWLSANFKGADRSARRWMRLYRERDRLPGGDPLRTGVSELTPSAALSLLAAREEPGEAAADAKRAAEYQEDLAVIRRSVKAGARSWTVLCRTIGAHPNGSKALAKVVAAARIGPPLPVSKPDLRDALETWSERDLNYRLLYANEAQPRLCGRILLAIESRGLFQPRSDTIALWRGETGWAGPAMDEAIAWARANPTVPAELPYSEVDCCLQAWRLLQVAEYKGELNADDKPSDQEHELFGYSMTAHMRIGAAAGWPWYGCTELFARAMELLSQEGA